MEYSFRPLWESPRVLDETETYLVVYKPPLMFSAPLDSSTGGTLLGWCAGYCPAVLEPKGVKALEGGLLHRLDFETEGLVLVAKTQGALESFRAQQGAGNFVKEYDALTCPMTPAAGRRPSVPGSVDQPGSTGLPGFPPPPLLGSKGEGRGPGPYPGAYIESFFRPWGPGRRAVRPVIRPLAETMNLTRAAEKKDRPAARDRGGYYRTEIIALKEFSGLPSAGGQGKAAGLRVFRLRIRRGFRHQIRCHLAWIGEPILNDTLYGLEKRYTGESCPIALRAAAFCFFDPATGKQKDYRLPLIGSG